MLRLIVILAISAAMLLPAPAAARIVRLENSHIAVELDADTGALGAIRDRESRVTYSFQGIPFTLRTDAGTWRPTRASGREGSKSSQVFTFNGEGFDAWLHYRLGPEDRFVEKWAEVRHRDGAPYFLEALVLEDVALGPEFRELHFHDDQTKWHCPINLFLRTDRGGCFAGLEYPYWQKELRGARGFRLGYAPNFPVAANDVFTSEKFFLGVYQYEGIYRYSHGPFPGDLKPALLTFNSTSVSHYRDTTDVPPEVLDWGEVWAMQAFMRGVLPRHALPETGYYTWVNSWWAWAWNQKWSLNEGVIDLLAKLGIRDVMTQSIWFGHGQHPMPVPYISRMDPRKPVSFTATPEMEALVTYGKRQGVNVTSFCCPGMYFDNRPEWLSRRPDGRPSHYNDWSQVSCPASDDYTAFMLQLYDEMLTKYGCRWWGFDGRWLSYREFPQDDGQPISADPCYAENHGHLPGDNTYREWRNINRLLSELRRRHPGICLESYYGLKRGGPWILRSLNATENYYEESSSDQMRFQLWHNQNDRFFPPDRNMTTLFARDSASFRHGLISMIAGGPYGQVGPGLHQLVHLENQAFFEKWRAWAGQNIEYLNVRRDLFPCPGYGRVDGSAQIIKDRGCLFLFPTGLQPNSHTPANDEGIRAAVRQFPKVVRAAIRLNHWLGLEKRSAAGFKVVELYPREGRVLGTYRYGETLLYDMPKDSAVVLSLMPAATGERIAATGFDPQATEVHVVRAFSEGLLNTREFLALAEPARAAAVLAKAGFDVAKENVNLVDGVAVKELNFPALEQAADAAFDLGDLRLRAPATIACWVWRNDLSDDRRLLSQLTGPIAQAGTLRLASKQLQVWDGRHWLVLVPDGLEARTWQHLAVAFSADGHATGFLNGQPQEPVACRCDYLGVRAGIGAKFLGQHGGQFSGALRDFQIRRHALTAAEVEQLRQVGKP